MGRFVGAPGLGGYSILVYDDSSVYPAVDGTEYPSFIPTSVYDVSSSIYPTVMYSSVDGTNYPSSIPSSAYDGSSSFYEGSSSVYPTFIYSSVDGTNHPSSIPTSAYDGPSSVWQCVLHLSHCSSYLGVNVGTIDIPQRLSVYDCREFGVLEGEFKVVL